MKYKLKIDPDSIVSVSDLRKNLSKYTKQAKLEPLVVFNRNKPEYVLIDFKKYQEYEEFLEGARIMAEFEAENPSERLTKEQLMKNLRNAGLL